VPLKQILAIAILAAVPATAFAQGPSKGPKQSARGAAVSEPKAISGQASSGRNCVGPSGANVHAIGWVPSNSRVSITFSSDFDPVAAVTNTALGSEASNGVAQTSYYADDDGGGNLEPLINFTASHAGTLALHVSKFSPADTAGCYFYKVEITTP
jgi:hypothetical protein